MNPLTSLRNWLEPTKTYPQYLAQDFYDELKPILRKMFRIAGFAILVLVPIFIVDEYFTHPALVFYRLLFVHLLEFLLMSIVIAITYFAPDRRLYILLYSAIMIELILLVLSSSNKILTMIAG